MLIHNADITGSLTVNGVPYNTGSFTGSFYGDGSQLSGVTSYTNADTLAFIQGYSGSYSGSFSGSFFGDGSNLSGVTSYTDADTLDFINSLNVVSGSIQTVSTVSDTFTSATSYTVTHNFGTKEVIVSVYENDILIFPSSITTPTVNTVTITFPEPVTGRVVVVKAGHIVSGSINYNSVLNKPTLVSGSSQITYSGLTGIPSGIVSGSSQISFTDITNKPTLVSGSSQVTYSGLTGIPSGIVSGSTQVAQFGYATTGSNQFKASQTITGSLTVTGVGTVSSSLTAGTFVRATGGTGAASGKGVEIGYESGDFGTIISYDRTAGSFKRLSLNDSLNILTNGNVGIGIDAPSRKLQVREAGTSTSGDVVAVRNDNVTSGAFINFIAGGVNAPSIGAKGNDLVFTADGYTGAEQMRITCSGNLGLGVTPSVWYNGYTALQIGESAALFSNRTSADTRVTQLANNAFLNSNASNWIYIQTDEATRYSQVSGEHQWFTAPSGTAGCSISFNQAMTLNASGNLSINNTNNTYRLDVSGLVNINSEATTNQGTVQSLRISSNLGNAAVTINSCSNIHYGYLTFAQGCVAKFEIGVAACTDPNFPSSLYINNNTQAGAANAAIRITNTGIASFQCQVCLPTSNTSLVAGTFGTISNVGGIDTNIGNNAYYDGTDWRRFAAQEAARIYINRDSFSFLRKSSGSAGTTISWDNTLFLASSGIACFTCQVCVPSGVKFGNGSGTLNYYELGTWTPRLRHGSFTTDAAANNAGWYIRVGNSVTVGGTLSWTNGSGSQNGTLDIVCLPFQSNVGGNYRNVGQLGAPAGNSIGFICTGKGDFTLVVDPGRDFIYIIETFQNGTYAAYTHSPAVNTSGIIYGFQATYLVQ